MYLILNYMLILLDSGLVLFLKSFLSHNSVNMYNLGAKIPLESVKREAIIMKINSLYIEVGRIVSVQADKKKQIIALLDESLESFVEAENSKNAKNYR